MLQARWLLLIAAGVAFIRMFVAADRDIRISWAIIGHVLIVGSVVCFQIDKLIKRIENK